MPGKRSLQHRKEERSKFTYAGLSARGPRELKESGTSLQLYYAFRV